MALILAIDDHDLMRNLLGDILGRDGHQVILARDGKEGLELLESNPGVELVITDLMLPGMDGLEVIRQLKAKRDLPIIAISGECLSSTHLERAARLGTTRTLRKPFAFAALLAAIDESLDGSPNRGHFKFLVLDDEPAHRTLNCRVLRKTFPGCSIIECATAGAALIRCLNEPVHAILADHHLGNEDGGKFVAQLRNQEIRCPILMVTSSSDPEVKQRALANGVTRVYGPGENSFGADLQTLLASSLK